MIIINGKVSAAKQKHGLRISHSRQKIKITFETKDQRLQIRGQSQDHEARAKANDVVTCEIKLFHNYFSLCRHPSEIILFHRVETCLKLV